MAAAGWVEAKGAADQAAWVVDPADWAAADLAVVETVGAVDPVVVDWGSVDWVDSVAKVVDSAVSGSVVGWAAAADSAAAETVAADSVVAADLAAVVTAAVAETAVKAAEVAKAAAAASVLRSCPNSIWR